jgi:hypothetical protein
VTSPGSSTSSETSRFGTSSSGTSSAGTTSAAAAAAAASSPPPRLQGGATFFYLTSRPLRCGSAGLLVFGTRPGGILRATMAGFFSGIQPGSIFRAARPASSSAPGRAASSALLRPESPASACARTSATISSAV